MCSRGFITPGSIRLLVLALLASAGTCFGIENAPAKRPNVLFVAIDDLNDWIGALGGHPGARTPHLDRLAESGSLFTRAYCAAPACNPSRTALMTGLAPHQTGVYHNGQPWRPVLPNAVTIAQHFRAHGYHVEGGGKIFHSATLRSQYNDPPSWEAYFDKPNDPYPKILPANNIAGPGHFDWGPVTEADEDMGDFQTVDWASQFLNQPHDRPFFLAVGLYRPHLPWYVPAKYFEQFPLDGIQLPVTTDDDLNDVPPLGIKMAKPNGDHRKVLESDNWPKAVQGYLASIAFADAQIGRLLDALDKSEHHRNTIVVLWSDHGWHLGEKQHWRKFSLWEEACRVVLMMRVPEVTKAGTRCDTPVNLLDIYPTLNELCGLPAWEELDGKSLSGLLKDSSTSWDRPALTTHGRNNHSLRTERYRYIRYSDGTEELYDHDVDPLEWKNLANIEEHKPVIDGLKKWLPSVNVAEAPNESAYPKPRKQDARRKPKGKRRTPATKKPSDDEAE